MRVLILGCGLVGKELARDLRSEGHWVRGTTTTASKVDELRALCDDVVVLRGSDTDRVRAAAQGCDAIAVCAGPAAGRAMTVEERKATYHEVLVATAESAVAAPIQGTIVALSSFSVYGDAANHLDIVDETSPLTPADDASPVAFQAAERVYAQAQDRACIFRCADIYGGEDPPIADKIKLAHQYMKGSVPFAGEALFYRVHVSDVVAAVKFALLHNLRGTFNLTHADVPPSCRDFFDAAGAAQGLPPLHFRNEIKVPAKPISTARLQATGFRLTHTRAERMP